MWHRENWGRCMLTLMRESSKNSGTYAQQVSGGGLEPSTNVPTRCIDPWDTLRISRRIGMTDEIFRSMHCKNQRTACAWIK